MTKRLMPALIVTCLSAAGISSISNAQIVLSTLADPVQGFACAPSDPPVSVTIDQSFVVHVIHCSGGLGTATILLEMAYATPGGDVNLATQYGIDEVTMSLFMSDCCDGGGHRRPGQ
ncbi:MAG: hypothetical protein ACE5IK_06415 [Acidobacteriota bacterium]